MIRSMGMITLESIFGIPRDEILSHLARPGVMRQLNIGPGDTLVIRDEQRRLYFDAEGKQYREEVQTAKPVAIDNPVKVLPVTVESQQRLGALRKYREAQDRFRIDFPEAAGMLDAFLTNSGCGICRGRVSEILRTPGPRANLFTAYLDELIAAESKKETANA